MRTVVKKISLIVSLVVMTLFAMMPMQARAQLSGDQQELFNNNILYFNAEDKVVCGNGADAKTDGSTVDRFLQVLAQQESNGNPTAHASTTTAAGKYQYITDTWHGVAKANYPPADQYATADLAPEPVQDAVAKIEYTKKFKIFNNDVFKLAVSHFLPAANQNPGLLDVVPPKNKITPRQYAMSIVNKINSGVGTNIGLHYSEAPDFGTYFAAAQGALPTPQNTAPSEVATTCGVGTISGDCGNQGLRVPEGGTGVNVCYFNQGDLRPPKVSAGYNWPGCGCLPTSILMVRSTFEKNPNLSPDEVLNGLKSKGGVFSDGCSGVIGGALSYYRSLGYDVQTILPRGGAVTDDVLTKIKDKLNQGYIIQTHTHESVDSAGKSGTAGHFLLIHAVDGQGNFYVANPGARTDNGKAIAPARIKAWLDEFYAVKK